MENRKKIKSGAQKAREKSMKLQMKQAKKCKNIASFFSSSKSSTNDSSQYVDKQNTDFDSKANSQELTNIMPRSSSVVQSTSTSKTNDFLNVSIQEINNTNVENSIINSNAPPVVVETDVAIDYFVKPNANMKNNFFEYTQFNHI